MEKEIINNYYVEVINHKQALNSCFFKLQYFSFMFPVKAMRSLWIRFNARTCQPRHRQFGKPYKSLGNNSIICTIVCVEALLRARKTGLKRFLSQHLLVARTFCYCEIMFI